jgi:hypothetical protein
MAKDAASARKLASPMKKDVNGCYVIDGRWRMADGAETEQGSAICHLPSAIRNRFL